MQHIIIDLEFNPVSYLNREKLGEEIIEIGAIKLDENCKEIGRYSRLIKPALNERIMKKITRLTGITTQMVENEADFKTVMDDFVSWVGEGEPKLYSWSETDLIILKSECDYKNYDFPNALDDWTDLQFLWHEKIELPISQVFSLKSAAEFSNIDYKEEEAHRALYDSEVTADLLKMIMDGSYKEVLKMKQFYITDEADYMTYSLADSNYGSLLASLLQSE